MISFCRGEIRFRSWFPPAPMLAERCDCEYSRSNGCASMKNMSVRDVLRASRATAYRLTRSPGASSASSRYNTVWLSASVAPARGNSLTVFSGPAFTE